MESIHNQIKSIVSKKRKGAIVFAEDFKKIGDGGTIRISLFRLCKSGISAANSQIVSMFQKIGKYINSAVLGMERAE